MPDLVISHTPIHTSGFPTLSFQHEPDRFCIQCSDWYCRNGHGGHGSADSPFHPSTDYSAKEFAQRVGRSEHSYIRNDWRIVSRMTITSRRHITDQRDMKVGPTVNYRFCIFRHTAIQFFHRCIVRKTYGIKIT